MNCSSLPSELDGVESLASRSGHFTPTEGTLDIHWTEGRVGTTANLDGMAEERDRVPPPGIEPRFSNRSAGSLVTALTQLPDSRFVGVHVLKLFYFFFSCSAPLFALHNNTSITRLRLP